MSDTQYKPNFAVHPGESLRDELEFLNISQVEFSTRADLSVKHISQIINGEASITTDTALKIERVLGGTPNAEFWSNLQKHYDLTITRLEAEKVLEKEVDLAKKYNYSELVQYGLVPATTNWNEKVSNLLSYLRFNSLRLVPKMEGVAFRRLKGKFNEESLLTWLRFGEIESKKISLERFDADKLKNSLDELKMLTFLPKDFYKNLQKICAGCGVAVVYTPYFKNTKLNGAVRWFGDNPLIQLNSKGVYSDIFWFTLFHEVGHILLHGKKDQFLDFDNSEKNQKEKEADEFASEILIPSNKFKEIREKGNLSIEEAKIFSRSVGVGFDVLIGRFCHENLLSWSKASKFRQPIKIG